MQNILEAGPLYGDFLTQLGCEEDTYSYENHKMTCVTEEQHIPRISHRLQHVQWSQSQMNVHLSV